MFLQKRYFKILGIVTNIASRRTKQSPAKRKERSGKAETLSPEMSQTS
jgi:hypothetical protein